MNIIQEPPVATKAAASILVVQDGDNALVVDDHSNSYVSTVEDGNGFEISNDNSKRTSFAHVEKIVQRETIFVRYLRIGLIIILVSLSIIAAVSVYFTVSKKEQHDFNEAFDDYSTKVAAEFQVVAHRRLGAIASFASSITTNAIASNSTWPFVTIPYYETQVRHIAELAHIPVLVFGTIVQSYDERIEWETKYVPQHIHKWVHESLISIEAYYHSKQDNDPTHNTGSTSFESLYNITYHSLNSTHETLGYSEHILDTIVSSSGDLSFPISNSTGPYMPTWQIAPFIPGQSGGTVNYDMNGDHTFDRNIISILSQHKAALGRITSKGYGDPYGYGIPTSSFYYPIVQNVSDDSPVVGSLGTLIFWLPFFSNILPESAIGMIGVLENTCNQQFTFRIDGSNVTYVADFDKHDTKYNSYGMNVSFSSLLIESYENQEYLGYPLDENGCQYTLYIYPSSDLENKYKTNTPIIAAIIVLFIFLTTSSLFILYDRLVERRQRIVMKEAESSGAIVSSLFPAAYRERLMAAQNANQNNTNKFTNVRGTGIDITTTESNNDQPIADLFPECTVFFADIAGFTHWSSTREPVQVFCLLQEVYAAIDKVAKQFTVFKVETIGDCYMAVTGLPNPQPNHAILMARFAKSCLLQMRETTTRLVDTLGDDTVELSLRIGLHSGPVTAGILRGEKSRFQLFGDTVNTASRMESTGEKNRIQISSTTADLIRNAGKGHWFTPREDLVDAKGKGKLQTYWLNSDRGPSTLSSTIQSGNRNSDDLSETNNTRSPWNESGDDLISI